MLHMIILAGITLALAGGAAGRVNDRSTPIDLGGARQAKAFLRLSGEDYVIRLRMLPVKVFEPATNARLNREKARLLALQSLARHLSGKATAEITVSGTQVEKAGTEGAYYLLTLRVPRAGVTLVEREDGGKGSLGEEARAKTERVVYSSALFTRKRDYADTVGQLAAAFDADLRAAERSARRQDQDAQTFAAAVKGVEDRAGEALEKLADEIKEDKLLLTIGTFDQPSEQEELLTIVRKQKARQTRSCREAFRRYKESGDKE